MNRHRIEGGWMRCKGLWRSWVGRLSGNEFEVLMGECVGWPGCFGSIRVDPGNATSACSGSCSSCLRRPRSPVER